jgi:hypothetical protein
VIDVPEQAAEWLTRRLTMDGGADARRGELLAQLHALLGDEAEPYPLTAAALSEAEAAGGKVDPGQDPLWFGLARAVVRSASTRERP